MSLKVQEFRERVLKWKPYLTWRKSYLERCPKVSRDWHVGVARLYKEKCFCIDEVENVRKCGCEIHLKMSELISGLKKWRRAVATKLEGHTCTICASDEYLNVLSDVSSFSNHVCPCDKDPVDASQRQLMCAKGMCADCQNVSSTLRVCDDTESECAQENVKFKWLRPVKIGNRNETEWAYECKPYCEFKQLLCSYYQDKYRLHNWVYKRQDVERHNNRKRLQRGQVILEFDYAAKATQFQQDSMPCSAARQTSHFVVFVHFNPTVDEYGINLGDTTEVFSFHSDCLIQDTHSIRRCLTHVFENMIQRGFLKDALAHLWADGCGAQNKGRKSYRQLSELSALLGLRIILNFPATSHFAGPWDTEGGRHTRAVRRHVQNERDSAVSASVLTAGDNVVLLRKILSKAGEPDPPIKTQKMWRPANIECTNVVRPAVAPVKPKPKRQARGRTDAELEEDDTDERYCISRRHILQVEPCPCVGRCSCPSDGRLTYKRDLKYDCSYIEGTRSTYCYAFNKKALRVNVRQFSCYCRWCSLSRYDKCISLDIVRHAPSKPVRTMQAGYTQWRNEGWRAVTLQAKSSPDAAVTRSVRESVLSAIEYVNKLSMGTTIAIMTKEDGAPSFWLASKHSDVSVADKNDLDTGITRGEKILDIIWYDRLTDRKYMKLDDISIVSASSVCVIPFKIVWQRTTANRYYLGERTHDLLMTLVNNISEI